MAIKRNHLGILLLKKRNKTKKGPMNIDPFLTLKQKIFSSWLFQ